MTTYTQRFSDTDMDRLEADLDMCNRVFVYGTLQKGQSNNSILSNSDLISSTTTREGFALGNVGFPYAFHESVVPAEYKKLLFPVQGEVYKIADMFTFASLDALEGYPSHYNRRIVPTASGLTAWMYNQDDWNAASRCSACKLEKDTWVWPKR